MVDPPTVPRDADIIAIGFASAVAILLLGLLLSVPFAGAQTVPFDGRIDEVNGSNTGPGSPTFGLYSGYQPYTYARIDWIPTSTGIFCGFETRITATNDIDVTMEGADIATVTWDATEPSATLTGFYLWPEECFTYTSGTTYSFTFANDAAVDHVSYIYWGSGTSTNHQVWQYRDGVGWYQLFGKYPDFVTIGTSDASSTEWYQQNVEPDLPADVSVSDWWGGWKDLGQTFFTEKAPFGYVSTVKAIWDDLETGTTSQFHITVNGVEVSMFDATATEAVVGTANWQILRGFMEALLWFAFMMYVIVRVNQIEV